MPQAFYILFGAALTGATALALGKFLLRGLRLRLYREEEHVLAFVAGSALLSALVFGICAAGVARKGVFLCLGLVVLAIAWRRGFGRPLERRLPPMERSWRYLFLAVFAVFFVLYFFNAMAPEISPDGTGYHLSLVSRYLREHGFHRLTTNMYANLSQGLEMLFVFAFAFGRNSSAALVHFLFLVALPLLMLSYARRFGFASAGVCGALFVFASPVVGIDGSSAYTDVAVACVVFAVFYLLQIWAEDRDPHLAIPIGVLAGFAYALKYTAFLAVPYALGFLAWKSWRSRKPCLKMLATVSACALAMMAPWLLKNWIWLGNPFSPFLNAWFPNPYVHVAFEREYAAFLRHYNVIKSYSEIPLSVTVRGTLSGVLGPLFLLAPLGLVAAIRREGRRLLFAALVFGATYFANVGTRFLIPALPFVALAMALAFTRIKLLAPALVLIHAVLSWPGMMHRYCDRYAWRLTEIPVRAALRIQPEDSFLSAATPSYAVMRMVESSVPPGAKIFAFSGDCEAYCKRDILVGYTSAFNRTIAIMLQTPMMPERIPAIRQRFGFPARSLRRVRVIETAAGEPDNWSIAELRVFRGATELQRLPSWRLKAHPNPWDVQMAFDNSPVTRWSSAQTLFPGMYVEVDFGKPEVVDSVLLESPNDQYKVRLKLEGQDGAGKWIALCGEPQQTEAPPPLGMRRAITEELKLRGIDYLLISNTDFGAGDFKALSDLWGIREIGERNRTRLYKIN